jgi:hypothetical protein
MSGWTIAKAALALLGLTLLVVGDRLGLRWLGYMGLVPLLAAFLLRFAQRRFDPQRKNSVTPD